MKNAGLVEAQSGIMIAASNINNLRYADNTTLIGEGNGNPFYYPCLENPMDRGGWCATVHVVSKSRI